MAEKEPSLPDGEKPGEEAKATAKERKPVTVAELRAAAKGVLYPSESDRAFKPFSWAVVGTVPPETAEDALVAATGADPKTLKYVPLSEFFEPLTTEQDWYGTDEKAAVERAKALLAFLRERLTDIIVIRVEKGPEIPAYVIGRDANEQWVGLKTELVET